MKIIKGVVFSLRDVLVVRGTVNQHLFDETVTLLKFLISREIEPVLVSNSEWVYTSKSAGERKLIVELLREKVGRQIRYFQGGKDGMPYKQTAGGMRHVYEQLGWSEHEAVYVGSTKEDMIAASNGGMLFLNAKWHADNSPHGFEFASPKDIARFIDCCCLTLGDWYWAHENETRRIYSIAPLAEYSRRYPGGAAYSGDAKAALKFDRGDIPFWGRLMAARLYFSGLATEADYVTPYPGHKIDSTKGELLDSLRIVSGSMRAQYLGDLIVRHQDADKSQNLRQQGLQPSHENQLSTIHLRRDPLRPGPSQRRYVNPPLKSGKTVIVVDDICTEGYSQEAAKAFIESTGARVISVTWLKTPGRNNYHTITGSDPEISDPYAPYLPNNIQSTAVPLNSGIRNDHADTQLGKAFQSYEHWDWPADI